ncbi:MAG TPA: DNA polymerase III subunit epsilon [Chloroflexi bacterium]|nr:DNA polymerase III subunit epsilon [Chloroflexota bacterium]
MNLSEPREIYISVDVETAGPTPRAYSLLSIGACVVQEPAQTFYIELRPVNENFVVEAMQVSGLDFAKLQRDGVPAQNAMTRFADWLAQVIPTGNQPIFVGFNASFDWLFIHDYFYQFLGHNPFGHKALDIKAYYMGQKGVTWQQTSMSRVSKFYLDDHPLSHNALQDALDQAQIFRQLLAEASIKQSP